MKLIKLSEETHIESDFKLENEEIIALFEMIQKCKEMRTVISSTMILSNLRQ